MKLQIDKIQKNTNKFLNYSDAAIFLSLYIISKRHVNQIDKIQKNTNTFLKYSDAAVILSLYKDNSHSWNKRFKKMSNFM